MTSTFHPEKLKPHGHYQECKKCGWQMFSVYGDIRYINGHFSLEYFPSHDYLRLTCPRCGFDDMFEMPADRKE